MCFCAFEFFCVAAAPRRRRHVSARVASPPLPHRLAAFQFKIVVLRIEALKTLLWASSIAFFERADDEKLLSEVASRGSCPKTLHTPSQNATTKSRIVLLQSGGQPGEWQSSSARS
jgi:hypothetical protein